MTEITVNIGGLHPRTPPPFWPFLVALLLAPIAIAALSFILVIPIFAAFYGYASYVIGFGPLAYWMLHTKPPGIRRFALLGLIAHVLNILIFGLLPDEMQIIWSADIVGHSQDIEAIGFYAGFGAVFAPLWAGMFALLYRSFTKPRKDPTHV